MAAIPRQSLLAPSGSSTFEGTIGWINAVLFGELAIGLSVIAVAFVGFTLLTGRLNIRLGGRVVLGIFLLLGAPAIAAALGASWMGSDTSGYSQHTLPAQAETPREDLPPAEFDPYAGASLRRD